MVVVDLALKRTAVRADGEGGLESLPKVLLVIVATSPRADGVGGLWVFQRSRIKLE